MLVHFLAVVRHYTAIGNLWHEDFVQMLDQNLCSIGIKGSTLVLTRSTQYSLVIYANGCSLGVFGSIRVDVRHLSSLVAQGSKKGFRYCVSLDQNLLIAASPTRHVSPND
jgi:hypothetical protein